MLGSPGPWRRAHQPGVTSRARRGTALHTCNVPGHARPPVGGGEAPWAGSVFPQRLPDGTDVEGEVPAVLTSSQPEGRPGPTNQGPPPASGQAGPRRNGGSPQTARLLGPKRPAWFFGTHQTESCRDTKTRGHSGSWRCRTQAGRSPGEIYSPPTAGTKQEAQELEDARGPWRGIIRGRRSDHAASAGPRSVQSGGGPFITRWDWVAVQGHEALTQGGAARQSTSRPKGVLCVDTPRPPRARMRTRLKHFRKLAAPWARIGAPECARPHRRGSRVCEGPVRGHGTERQGARWAGSLALCTLMNRQPSWACGARTPTHARICGCHDSWIEEG